MKPFSAAIIIKRLKKDYPQAGMTLNYKNNIELLVAVMLSAQCTDKQVNKVTQRLFKKYKSADDYAEADLKHLQRDIRSAGFYRNKARYLKAAAVLIKNKFNSKVPGDMKNLLKLPGVARKTANVVLYHGFGRKQGIAVDTHVGRVSRRLGIANAPNAVQLEKELMRIIPRKYWGEITNLFIEHGRRVCQGRKPACANCCLTDRCAYFKAILRDKR